MEVTCRSPTGTAPITYTWLWGPMGGTAPITVMKKTQTSLIEPGASEGITFDQAGVYPSDLRGVPALLTPASHGNGFWSSGFMDRSDATPQPKTSQVKIVAPGTYTFYCLLHPFMKTVVTAG